MSLVRIYPAGWGVGEKLTSAQQNALDINVTNAADKQAGTDSIACLWTLTGAGRIVQAPAAGADADTTYVATGANRSIRVTTAVTANRFYTLGNAGAEQGDRIMLFCDPAFAYEITVKNHDATILYSLGFLSTSESGWAEFIFAGADWRLFQGPGATLKSVVLTAGAVVTVPRGVTKMILDGVAGGGGGGGGRGNGTGGDGSAPGGGGARRARFIKTVVPGEDLTFVVGAGGNGGTGGNAGGAVGTSGAHGTDGTVTGSTSGLLATWYGAQGAVFATNSAGFYKGGLPVRWVNLDAAAATRQYPKNSTSPLTNAGLEWQNNPIPGQGGFSGSLADASAKAGGSTQYAVGGAVTTVDGTQAGSGGASEWPGGTGGTSGGGVSAFVSGVSGGNGTLGSGGGGGAGGYTTPVAGGNGGNGGNGAIEYAWLR